MEKKERIRVEISIALKVERETGLKVLDFTSAVPYPLPQKTKQEWRNIKDGWILVTGNYMLFCQQISVS